MFLSFSFPIFPVCALYLKILSLYMPATPPHQCDPVFLKHHQTQLAVLLYNLPSCLTHYCQFSTSHNSSLHCNIFCPQCQPCHPLLPSIFLHDPTAQETISLFMVKFAPQSATHITCASILSIPNSGNHKQISLFPNAPLIMPASSLHYTYTLSQRDSVPICVVKT